MEKQKITIEKRNIYGNDLYYPACSKSEQFCILTGKKTLGLRELNVIKNIGFEIDLKTDKLEL